MSQEVVLNVSGMSCNHCVMSVTKAVKEIEGVENVNVNLEKGTVTIEFSDELEPESLVDQASEAIEEAGYELK